MARAILIAVYTGCNYDLYSNYINARLTEIPVFHHLQVQQKRPPLGAPLRAFGILPGRGGIMCARAWAVEHTFEHCCAMARKASTISNSANIMPSL